MEEQVRTNYQEEVAQEANGNLKEDEKLMAILAHVLGLLFGWLAPLIIWLLQKDSSSYVDEQAKEALNFQISMLIYLTLAGFSVFILIGFLLLPILGVFGVVVAIIAAIRANEGTLYRYPACIRFIK